MHERREPELSRAIGWGVGLPCGCFMFAVTVAVICLLGLVVIIPGCMRAQQAAQQTYETSTLE